MKKYHRWHRGFLSLTVLVMFFMAISPASALDPTKKPDQHTLNIFTTEDGLPQSSVMNLVQTKDGYLWMGTFEGLARYDGE